MTIIQSLQKKLRDHDVDGFLIMSPINRRYVTGFTGTAGAVLLTETDARFITDFRYVEQAEEQVHGFQIVKQAGTLMNEIAVQSSSLGIKKLGFEKTKLTYAEYEQLEQTLTGATLVAINQMVEPLRLIKTPEEIQTMKKAADIAEKRTRTFKRLLNQGSKKLTFQMN